MSELLEEAYKSIYQEPVVNKHGEVLTYLNSDLISSRGISEGDVEKLKRSHLCLDAIKQKMKASSDTTRIRQLARRIQTIEYIQQKLWKFPQDHTFHNWYNVPHCTCPKMDNADRKGSKFQIRTASCIVHGA